MRYTGPSCKQCRRETTKLFLKGTKCFTEKCPVERRPYPPGQHGQNQGRRRKASEYSKQLREKQKTAIYGVSEQQSATRLPGHTLRGSRAQSVGCTRKPWTMVYRIGSRRAARPRDNSSVIAMSTLQPRFDVPSYQ